MTKEEAWKLLEVVTAQINVNRDVHNKILMALQVLKPEQFKTE